MSARTTTRDPRKLVSNFDVRARLDDDRVLFFAQLYEAGVEVEPLIITEEDHIIDGRHRREGALLADMKAIEVKITHETDRVKLIGEAFRRNYGGPLPPTHEDIEHTVSVLLGMKVGQNDIIEILSLPRKIVRRLIADVISKDIQARKRRAVHAVLEGGLTVPKAAEQFGLDEKVLRQNLGGEKRKKSQMGLGELKSRLSREQLSQSKKNGELIKRSIDNYKDGEATESFVGEVIDHLLRLNSQARGRLEDWMKRFNAARGKTTDSEKKRGKPSSKMPKKDKATKSVTKSSGKSMTGKLALKKMGLD